MLLALALSLHLVAAAEPPPSLHLLERAPLRAGLLLSQAPALAREGDLLRQIDDLNSRIRAHNTDWPLGAIIGAYFGFGAAIPAIPVGLIITLVGAIAVTTTGIILIVGLIVTGVGVLGLCVGIYSLVTGSAAQTAAKEEKGDLIRQRDALERELKTLRQAPPPAVQRPLQTEPVLLTLATF